MTRPVLLICISLCTLLLAGVFAVTSLWLLAATSLAVGAGWFLLEWRGQGSAADAGMAGIILLSVVQIVFGSSSLPMVLVVVLALSAWDLSRFRQRMPGSVSGYTVKRCSSYKDMPTKPESDREETHRSIERKHLRRLLIVDVVGMISAILSMGFQFHLGFYLILLVGGLALLAIYRMLISIAGFVRQEDG
ncbi:MAG: hypothetical protein JXB07_16175 [Anaerolineae bacterium]|nr:hypothetical protein [Anaerolineae bacterium]